MSRLLLCLLFIGASFNAMATAGDAKDQAIRKDREQIEGRWKIISLVVHGDKVSAEDRKKVAVINNADGTWKLISEGDVISKGTSSIDPTKEPKTIDFTVTEGEGAGNQHHGIYELGKKTRKMCFAGPSEERPTEFKSTTDNKHVCVRFRLQEEE